MEENPFSKWLLLGFLFFLCLYFMVQQCVYDGPDLGSIGVEQATGQHGNAKVVGQDYLAEEANQLNAANDEAFEVRLAA